MSSFEGATSTVTDLKGELASLKIDRQPQAASPWRWPLLLLVPALLIVVTVYALRIKTALAAPEIETVTAAVLRPSEAAAGTPILTASGYLVARRKAVVSAKIQGRLAELRVEEGSRVRKDEILAVLERADYEASVARARAAVMRAEADLAENRRQLRIADKLTADGILDKDQREATESRVRMADASLAQAKADQDFSEAQLANTEIRAPFAGVVVKKMAEVGESVAPIPPGVNISTSSGAIVALADLDTLEVEADVAESNVSKLGDRQPAEVAVEAVPDRRYKAILRMIIPTADRTKATVQVKVTILDKDKDLRPEMSATVTFLEPQKTAVAGGAPPAPTVTVPKEAVATRDGKPVVFEVRGDKAVARPVTVSAERQGQVVVRTGLSGGETLVRQPPDGLKDGDTVKVKG
jgi:RND family efflux transporter MFP subunit